MFAMKPGNEIYSHWLCFSFKYPNNVVLLLLGQTNILQAVHNEFLHRHLVTPDSLHDILFKLTGATDHWFLPPSLQLPPLFPLQFPQ